MDDRKLKVSDAGSDLIAAIRKNAEEWGATMRDEWFDRLTESEDLLVDYIASLEADQRRLDYATKHFICLDFAYDAGGETPESVAVIGLPATGRYGSDLRQTIDSAILNTGETNG